MPIRPPCFLRKRNPGPEYYQMTCTKCDFDRKYELARNYTVIGNPEEKDSEMYEIVEKLPEVCPKCGAKLKKEKLPVRIFYGYV